ncbi:MAG TPA: hypothetical protein VHD85_08155, partial [Terracidiphilus sp.]|nr:hypothetical protein [Terracidiphilus sp.]
MNTIWQSHAARIVPGDPLVVLDPRGIFQPSRLPRLPLSLVSHAQDFFHHCYMRYGRCIAALLILNMRSGEWTSPRIPRQTCGTQCVCAIQASALSELPADYRVLGSLQSIVAEVTPLRFP